MPDFVSARTTSLLYPEGLFEPGYLSSTKSLSISVNGSISSSEPYATSRILSSITAESLEEYSDSSSQRFIVAMFSDLSKTLKINTFFPVFCIFPSTCTAFTSPFSSISCRTSLCPFTAMTCIGARTAETPGFRLSLSRVIIPEIFRGNTDLM